MTVFSATLNQTAFLLLFILVGYVLSKWKFVPDNAQTVLSKLENTFFIPALVLGTFIDNFTTQTITTAWKLLLGSLALAMIAIGLSLLCVRFCSKDKYERNIYTYGLCFSNFGFMGNAVVSALFPHIFLEYLIFTLPLWTLIYLWGVPVLLMGGSAEKQTLGQRAKSFLNPMFAGMLLGVLIGLTNMPVPQFIRSAVAAAGSCMSPVAMLLTGMTIAQFNLREVLNMKGVYLVTALRLLVFPLLFLGAMLVFPMPETFSICAICSLAMPLGLNTIIIPSALGKDTKVASGMALVSHILSCLTIPVIFMLFQYVLM
ncbi:MAG: AEC family transporter [Oscillospiraceae bacterium]|nr:AEC family transporter [Oscillospiraceae bacterium]MBQ6832628.1 AEC family transporter [Oscillospiraceae bacterium]